MISTEPDLIVQILPDGTKLRFSSGQPITIGRDPAVQVVVDHGEVSRRHAVALVEPGTGWVLMDRSTNGTFLGNQRIGRIVISGPLTVRIGDPHTGVEVRLAPASRLRAGVAGAGQPGNVGEANAGSGDPASSGQVGTSRNHVVSNAGAGNVRSPAGGHPNLGQLGVLKSSRLGLGQFSRLVELPAVRIRIGRAPDNDVVVPDLLVSRYHAEVTRNSDGRYVVADLGSHNGTYLNGQRLQGRSTVSDGAVIAIGHHSFVLSGGRLEEFIDTGSASFAALALSVRVGTKYLLKDLSFAADGGDFVTVLGPTGAGKSTLIKALSGYRPADSGSVLYNGRDIYASY